MKKCTLWLEFRETVQNNDKMLHSIINGETLELPFPVDKEIRQKSKRLPFRRMPAEEETDSDEPLVVTRSDSKTKHTKILCPVPDCDRELAGFRRFEDHCLTHLDSTKVRASLLFLSRCAGLPLSTPPVSEHPLPHLPICLQAQRQLSQTYVRAHEPEVPVLGLRADVQ